MVQNLLMSITIEFRRFVLKSKLEMPLVLTFSNEEIIKKTQVIVVI